MLHRCLPAIFASVLLCLTGVVTAAPASADPVVDPAAPCGYISGTKPVPMGSNAPSNKPIAEGDYFSYPNRSKAERKAIRDKVLATINSTNGTYCVVTATDPLTGVPTAAERRHGVVRVATWSFNDWDVTNALKAAKARGASVQAIAARKANESEGYKPWFNARDGLGYYRGTVPSDKLNDDDSWAHDCAGSCRGGGGTHHSKYFLFKDVGTGHIRNIVVQSSMNLTKFAYTGQWNFATAWRNHNDMYDDFMTIFNQSAQEQSQGYEKFNESGNIQSIFFPNFSVSRDPVMDILSGGCSGGRIRLINYAIYDERGNYIAQRLRQLWNNGCDIKIIYSISSRPVLSILRSKSGRGPIPMKQSVIKNKRGEVKKYNHSKWIAVGNRVLAGSCNWSDMNNDEQHQEFSGAGPFISAFNKTWSQSSSKPPPSFRTRLGARQIERMPEQPQWGQGELKYLTPEG